VRSPRVLQDLPVPVVIVSDLHLGAARSHDLLRHGAPLDALIEGFDGADELVLLGDLVELREAPVARVLDRARPVLAEIDRALDGRRVTIVPGNHDHQLALPLLEQLRLEGRALEVETLAAAHASGPLGAVAGAFSRSAVRVAYPGVWVRDDVYATHGHYLDVHNTVPSFERIAIGAVQRMTARVPASGARADDYEAAVGPVYALAYALAQSPAAAIRQDQSARIWAALGADGPRGLGVRLAGGLGVPAVVKLLNAAGLGPLDADLSGQALRESALRGMREVIEQLAIGARHVVFGHTHRSGPHERDRGWGGLFNCGSWIHEPFFLGAAPHESPYWPGHCVWVPDGDGPPELRRLLTELPSGT
jgi:hypothetical protein